MMENNIRLMEEKDLDDVLELLSEVLEIHAKGRPDIFKSGTEKYDKTDLLNLMNNKDYYIFVYDNGSRVIGYSFCILKEHKNKNEVYRKEFFIDDLCVYSKNRRQGIGLSLYEYVKNFAKSLDCLHVTLNVWCCNPDAIKFYEKIGMKPYEFRMEELL